MTASLFLPWKQDESELYRRLREHPQGPTTRDSLEELWCQYESHAHKSFRRKLQIEFHQRWWEMYLTVGLLRLGLHLSPSKSDVGPDLSLVDAEGTKLWFEAVAPKIGTKTDRVPEPVLDGVMDLPKRESLLRLVQALNEKRKVFDRYIEQSTVGRDDGFIIALSACALHQFGTLLDWPCPAPLAVLAGVGDLAISFQGDSPSYCIKKRYLVRDSGSLVDTSLFDQEEFRIVAGVLYSAVDPLNAPKGPETSFELFLNPNAHSRAAEKLRGLLPTWSLFETDRGEVTWKKTKPTNAPPGAFGVR